MQDAADHYHDAGVGANEFLPDLDSIAMATTIPKVKLGDIVAFTQFFSEPGTSMYAAPRYRVVPAIIVATNPDGTVDLTVFERSIQGVSFNAGIAYDADPQQPGSWRPR